MKQDEVDLIYGYLHENYEYRDGELIKKSGVKLGYVFIPSKTGKAYMKCSLTVNGKQKFHSLSKIIFLYHTRRYPKYIDYLDGNPFNNKIDNIFETIIQKMRERKTDGNKGIFKVKLKNGYRFYPNFFVLHSTVGLGGYDTEEAALEIYEKAKQLYLMDIKITPNEFRKKFIQMYPHLKIKEKPRFKGVYRDGNRFVAYINHDGKKKHIGQYSSEEEAHAAYIKAKDEYKNGQ